MADRPTDRQTDDAEPSLIIAPQQAPSLPRLAPLLKGHWRAAPLSQSCWPALPAASSMAKSATSSPATSPHNKKINNAFL